MNSLTAFLTENVCSVIRIQQTFDEAYDQELRRLAVYREKIQAMDPYLVSAFIPPQMQVSAFEISCEVQLGQSREITFDLGVQMTPLRFYALHGRAEEEVSRLSIQVKRTPVQLPPNGLDGQAL